MLAFPADRTAASRRDRASRAEAHFYLIRLRLAAFDRCLYDSALVIDAQPDNESASPIVHTCAHHPWCCDGARQDGIGDLWQHGALLDQLSTGCYRALRRSQRDGLGRIDPQKTAGHLRDLKHRQKVQAPKGVI